MTKEELKQEAEEYTETKGKEHFRKFYNSDKNIAELITQVYMDCAEPREKRIAELEKEKDEIRRKADKAIADKLIITATYNEVLNNLNQENDNLKKENAELKSRDCWKACEYANPKSELIEQHIKDVQNLSTAKEIIKKLKALYLSPVVTKGDVKRQDEILNEAEQFLNSEVEK